MCDFGDCDGGQGLIAWLIAAGGKYVTFPIPVICK